MLYSKNNTYTHGRVWAGLLLLISLSSVHAHADDTPAQKAKTVGKYLVVCPIAHTASVVGGTIMAVNSTFISADNAVSWLLAKPGSNAEKEAFDDAKMFWAGARLFAVGPIQAGCVEPEKKIIGYLESSDKHEAKPVQPASVAAAPVASAPAAPSQPQDAHFSSEDRTNLFTVGAAF